MTRILCRLFLLVCLLAWLLFALGPYLWMVLTSVKPLAELNEVPIHYLPQRWTVQAYIELFSSTRFVTYMLHSLVVAVATVGVTLAVAIPAGYSLSRRKFRGKKVILSGLVASQFLPSILLVLGLFPIMRELGLIHRLVGLVVIYVAFVSPFTSWLMKGFFDAIPRELDEAGLVDGCGEFRMMYRILLPPLLPGVVAASVYIFIFSWNEFLFALTFASNSEASTLPVGLNTFIGDFVTRWDLLTAGGVVAAIPILVFFMLVQRRLISGLTAGAVKS